MLLQKALEAHKAVEPLVSVNGASRHVGGMEDPNIMDGGHIDVHPLGDLLFLIGTVIQHGTDKSIGALIIGILVPHVEEHLDDLHRLLQALPILCPLLVQRQQVELQMLLRQHRQRPHEHRPIAQHLYRLVPQYGQFLQGVQNLLILPLVGHRPRRRSLFRQIAVSQHQRAAEAVAEETQHRVDGTVLLRQLGNTLDHLRGVVFLLLLVDDDPLHHLGDHIAVTEIHPAQRHGDDGKIQFLRSGKKLRGQFLDIHPYIVQHKPRRTERMNAVEKVTLALYIVANSDKTREDQLISHHQVIVQRRNVGIFHYGDRGHGAIDAACARHQRGIPQSR